MSDIFEMADRFIDGQRVLVLVSASPSNMGLSQVSVQLRVVASRPETPSTTEQPTPDQPVVSREFEIAERTINGQRVLVMVTHLPNDINLSDLLVQLRMVGSRPRTSSTTEPLPLSIPQHSEDSSPGNNPSTIMERVLSDLSSQSSDNLSPGNIALEEEYEPWDPVDWDTELDMESDNMQKVIPQETRDFVNRLPFVPIESIPEDEASCNICLESFASSKEKAVLLSCCHRIGSDCIQRWLAEDNNTCPFCRTNIYKGTELERRHDNHQDDIEVMQDWARQRDLVARGMEELTRVSEELIHEGEALVRESQALVQDSEALVHERQRLAHQYAHSLAHQDVDVLERMRNPSPVGHLYQYVDGQAVLQNLARRVLEGPRRRQTEPPRQTSPRLLPPIAFRSTRHRPRRQVWRDSH